MIGDLTEGAALVREVPGEEQSLEGVLKSDGGVETSQVTGQVRVCDFVGGDRKRVPQTGRKRRFGRRDQDEEVDGT